MNLFRDNWPFFNDRFRQNSFSHFPAGIPRRATQLIALLLLWGVGILLAACIPDLSHPPRLTVTIESPVVDESNSTPLLLEAPTPTGEPHVQPDHTTTISANPTVTLWVNRTSRQYEATLQEMIAAFTAEHNVNVELVTIAPDRLPEMVHTAAVSDTVPLPDLMVFPLEYAAGWSEQGILDIDAADAVVQELDQSTFNPEALELVTVDGQVSAIPSDGWQQLLIYRRDWFEERNLAPPSDFETMLAASEVISDRVNLIYSFNMPTESSLRATTRAFEQMAIANGCQLIDEKGELLILRPECRDAFEFYRYICNTYCPPNVQTEVSALNAYLEGRAAMIIAPPGVLPAIAGLDDMYRPSCPACETPTYLAENTGIVTSISGRHPQASPQNLGAISYLGITSDADREAAMAFARFWFNEGYLRWLAVEPENKVPMRLGTAEAPNSYLEAWYDFPVSDDGRTLSDFYGRETATTLAENVVNSNRWGYKQGQGVLVAKLYRELTFSILLQELLSGYYNSERAAIEGYKRLVELIPDYPYYVDPEPTPED